MQYMHPAGSDTPTWPGTASANTPPANQPAYYPPAGPARPVQSAQPGYVAPQPPARPYNSGLSPSSRLLHALGLAVALLLAVAEGLLAIRIVLLLLAANPTAIFSSYIYVWTAPLVAPFQGVFPNVSFTTHVFDVTALLALVVYAIAARLLEAVVRTLERV